jgi:hypothetical protein
MPLVLIKSDKKAREKPCLRCGYSLRRIDSLHCPECGLSVWRSLNSNDALDWSHPLWLARLSKASAVLAVVQVIGLVAYLAANITYLGPLLRINLIALFWLKGWRVYPFVYAAYEFALAISLVLLAAEEGRHPDKWKPFRVACRIVAAVVALMGAWTLFTAAGGISTRSFRPYMFLRYALNLSIIAGTLTPFAYLRKLAQRIPNSRIVWFCGWIILGPALSLLKTVPIFSVWLAFEFSSVIFAYLPLIYLPVTAALLVWFARSFHRASIAAKMGWESETAQGA